MSNKTKSSSRWEQLNISTKLLLGFSITLSLTVVLGIFALVSLTRVYQNTREIAEKALPELKASSELLVQVNTLRRKELLFLVSEGAAKAGAQREMGQAIEGIQRAEKNLESVLDPDFKGLFGEYSKARAEYMEEHAALVGLISGGKTDEAKSLMAGRSQETLNSMLKHMQVLDQAVIDSSKRDVEQVQGIYNSSFVWVGLLLISSIGLGGFLSIKIARSITRPLGATVDRLGVVATGDLTQRVDDVSANELGVLGQSMNSFLENLDRVLSRVFSVSKELTRAASELNEASLSLSSGTEQTSQQSRLIADTAGTMNHGLQSLASAIEEMSSSISEVARQAADASVIATDANAKAASTTSVVRDLGQSADEIGKFIESIASIAAQTNLLALNAAIEAAGAGDAGKGFAVVAAEVKELARQAGLLSEDIKGRISSIQKSTDKTIGAIEDIAAVIRRVNEISGSIASAVEEQSITSREIASNVAQISCASTEVTKNINGISDQARVGAKDAARTLQLSQSLKELAVEIDADVSGFKLGNDNGGSRNSARRVAALN
ncbi:MAG: methyl-accepting chemotaxis protein [Leptospirales bacterium]|nr:methyl-accepting chemotaxis protein [Leptospirales bacterium]